MRLVDYIGKKFGRLFVINVAIDVPGRRERYVYAHCECGKIKDYRVDHLEKGLIVSCKCFQRERSIAASTTHGLSKHPLFKIWNHMKMRCYNPNVKSYKHYGGRGISICDAWLNDFKVFYDWAISHGWQKGLEIDRENVHGNYEPNNCRFVTSRINSQNRTNSITINYNGVAKNLMQWARELNVNYKHLYACVKYKNLSIEEALSKYNFSSFTEDTHK